MSDWVKAIGFLLFAGFLAFAIERAVAALMEDSGRMNKEKELTAALTRAQERLEAVKKLAEKWMHRGWPDSDLSEIGIACREQAKELLAALADSPQAREKKAP